MHRKPQGNCKRIRESLHRFMFQQSGNPLCKENLKQGTVTTTVKAFKEPELVSVLVESMGQASDLSIRCSSTSPAVVVLSWTFSFLLKSQISAGKVVNILYWWLNQCSEFHYHPSREVLQLYHLPPMGGIGEKGPLGTDMQWAPPPLIHRARLSL